MRLWNFYVVLSIMSGLTVHAQLGGKHVYQFLNLASAPKQAALGGRHSSAAASDPLDGLYNPAAINAGMHRHLSVSYMNYLADINYGTAAYAFALPTSQDGVPTTLQAGVTYLNYGQFDGYDAFGNSEDSFGGAEVALSLGSALRIPKSRFYAGANLKLVSSKLAEYTSFGGALDFGLMYRNADSGLHVGLVVRNAGLQFTTYAGQKESLPLEVTLGFSRLLQNVPIRWSFSLENLQQWQVAFGNPVRDQEGLGTLDPGKKDDPGFLNNALRHILVGVEFLPQKKFTIRLGYNFRRGEELRIVDQRTFAGVSAGVGLKIRNMKFSYSYLRYNAAGNSSFFGLTIALL